MVHVSPDGDACVHAVHELEGAVQDCAPHAEGGTAQAGQHSHQLPSRYILLGCLVNCWAAMPLILRQDYMQALPAYLLSEKRSCRQFADKHERQNAVMDYYINGNDHALDRFPGGSEPGT